jgi:hypothetical protein
MAQVANRISSSGTDQGYPEVGIGEPAGRGGRPAAVGGRAGHVRRPAGAVGGRAGPVRWPAGAVGGRAGPARCVHHHWRNPALANSVRG